MLGLSNNLRQRLWRWHFFAGVLVCPFLILLAVTGSIYLFKAEIENWQEININASGPPIRQSDDASKQIWAEQDLLNKVFSMYPSAVLKKITLAKQNDRTVEIEIMTSQEVESAKTNSVHAHHNESSKRKLILWVDRYSGEVLSTKAADQQFLYLVKKLHSELLLGKKGSYIVELAASWSLILLLSGTLIWIYRGKGTTGSTNKLASAKGFRQTFNSKIKVNQRINTRNLHGQLGFYLLVPLMIMILSGLPWTQLWGNGFKELKQFAGWGGPSQEWFVTLKSNKPNTNFAEDMLWTTSDEENATTVSDQTASVNADTSINLSLIAQKSEVQVLTPPVEIYPPKPDNGVWTVRSMPPDRSKRVTMHFDQFSGEQIMRIDFEDHHPIQRLVSHGISLHEGALFGLLNKVLVLITAVAAALLSILGLVTWYRRKRPGEFSAPIKANERLPRGWLLFIIALGVFLPAAGLSMLILLVVDLSLKRLPRPAKE